MSPHFVLTPFVRMSKIFRTISFLVTHGRPLSTKFVNTGSLIKIGHVYEARNFLKYRIRHPCDDTLDAIRVADAIVDGSRHTSAQYVRVRPTGIDFYTW